MPDDKNLPTRSSWEAAFCTVPSRIATSLRAPALTCELAALGCEPPEFPQLTAQF
jgi:hypothetical protein